MGGRRRRRRLASTDDWEQLWLLLRWPEQVRYEEIRPLVLFGSSIVERATETGTSERTLYRRADRFDDEGMESLFDAEAARSRQLPPSLRRLIVDIKAEHPRMGLGEIANICYVFSGRKPSKHTVKRVLEAEPMPLRMIRRFDRYHEIPEPRERRTAVVRLHAGTLTVEHAGETLSRHDVEVAPGTGKLRAITRSRVYETSHALSQPRLFRLEALG